MNILDISKYKLHDLLGQEFVIGSYSLPDLYNDKIVFNDFDVMEGDIFFCIPSIDKAKEKNYIENAVARGAKIIIKEQCTKTNKKNIPYDICIIKVNNARKLKSYIANKIYYKHPQNIVAVTGTNGKTSVVDFVRQIWHHLGYNSSSIGTMGNISNIDLGKISENTNTTPDTLVLHKYLSLMYEKSINNVAIEASSHGISQHRLDNVNFNACAFTNLSQDHLDYHNSLQEYFNVKKELFSRLLHKEQTAVINFDSEYFKELQDICYARNIKLISYGMSKGAHIRLLDLKINDMQQLVNIEINKKQYNFTFNIAGRFQLYNLMCAIGLVISSDIDCDKVISVLPKLQGVPGRMEFIGKTQKDGLVFVDYAHTPDALKEVLLSARYYATGKLNIVFGCGGDRDKDKRGKMGYIASHNSDVQYITDDNPRTENPCFIRQQIINKCPDGIEIADRYNAIKQSIDSLDRGDVCVIAGKGHENEQVLHDKTIQFDDRKIIKDILKSI